MQRSDVVDLHFICPISNLPSILRLGILSHVRAEKHSHTSVAAEEIQERRVDKQIPGGRMLHEYANLYFNARNPMMRRRAARHKELTVLRVSARLLDLPDTVIADMNASSDYVRFGASPGALKNIDKDRVFARDWRHPGDERAYWRHKSVMCAEVLVPDYVDASYIDGAYVSCDEAKENVVAHAPALPVLVNADLFFQV